MKKNKKNPTFATEEDIKILAETIEFVKNFNFKEDKKSDTKVIKNIKAA